MYLLPRKLLRRMREAQRLCHILLSLESAIALVMILHHSKDLLCFSLSFGANSGWCNVERTFSDVHMLAVVTWSSNEADKEALTNSAVDGVSSWNDFDSHTVGKEMDCSTVAMYTTRRGVWMKWIRAKEAGEISRSWSRMRTANGKRKTEVKKQVYWEHKYDICDVLYSSLEKFWFR